MEWTLSEPIESKRKVGYIPDRPYLYEKLTAREFLRRFTGKIYGLSEATIRQRDRASPREMTFSIGQTSSSKPIRMAWKQRLTLANSLLHDPDVLIVDEPMVGLDPHGAKQIKNRFRQLANDGKNVFLSTHSLDVAQEVCDRVGIYFQGRLVALDTVDNLLSLQSSSDLEEVFLTITEEQRNQSEPQ